MKSTKFKTKTEKGITLIALIITIVVLLILAVVAINSITNDGIINKAEGATDAYNQAVENEKTSLQDYEDMLTAANGGYKDKNFKVGDTVTVAGENFYVIEDKTAQGKVVLLAKQNIIPYENNANYLTQSESANTIAFSEKNYWADAEGNILNEYEQKEDAEGNVYYDLTETGIPDASHYALRAAYAYGVKIGGKGRLMTYKEAYDLSKTDFSTKLYGTNFWLGSAGDSSFVWLVYGLEGSLTYSDYDYADLFGVRPVIEISKSKVTAVTE